MTNEITEVDKLKTEVPALVREAMELQIRNDADNQRAADIVGRLGTGLKRAEEILKPLEDAKKAAAFAHKDMKDRIYTPVYEARTALRERISDYVMTETRRREAIAAEAQRKADLEAKKAQKKAERQGIPIAAIAPAPIISATPVKVAGASFVDYYSAEVTDLITLVKAVATGKAPLDAICANDTWLNATARNRKTEGEMFPGVKSVKRSVAKSIRG